MGNIGIWQLLIVAVIIVLLFGTKKLRNLGGDLGSSVKGFKKAMNGDANEEANADEKKTLDNKESASVKVETEEETVQKQESDRT